MANESVLSQEELLDIQKQKERSRLIHQRGSNEEQLREIVPVVATSLLTSLLTSGDIGNGLNPAIKGIAQIEKQNADSNARLEKAMLARQAASKTKTNLVKAIGPDGKPQFVEASQAIGMQPAEKESQFFLDDKISLEEAKARLKRKGDNVVDAGKLKDKVFKKSSDLRKEFRSDKVTLNTNKIVESFNKIESIVKAPQSGPGDVALVFAFMKILDPGSTVREGEQATARQAGTVPENIWHLYNRLEGSDEKLPSTLRKKFRDTAKGLVEAQEKAQQPITDMFANIANKNNLPLDEVLVRTKVKFSKPRSVELDAVNKRIKELQEKQKRK